MDDNKSTAGHIPRPLTEVQLKKLVLEAIDEDAASPETFHALYGHVERNISTDDVLFALRARWKKFKAQEPFNKQHWQWKYRVLSEDADGRELVLIIAVDTANREFQVVTRWAKDDDSA
jgi:hypothetical protein